MKFLFDLLPVIFFFGVFKWAEGNAETAHALTSHYLSGLMSDGSITASQSPILLATAIAILASFAQIAYLLVRRQKIDAMLWISLAIIVVFGGATIYFHDETFIKWKPTILYWCFATSLLFSQLVLKKNLIRKMMEKQVTLPDNIWSKLSYSWILFFVFMGLLNLYIAFTLSTDAWVNFKMFGGMGLMMGFIILQSVYLSKHMKDAE